MQDDLALWRAEREIGRVILRYARAVDRLDFDAVRSCFHEDAVIRYDEWFEGGLDEAMAWLSASMPKLLGTLHVFNPPWIELAPDGRRATAESYAVNSARYPLDREGQIIQNVTGTRYFDTLEFRSDRWAIVSRRTERAWRVNQPVGDDPPLPSSPPTHSDRAKRVGGGN